MIFLLYHRTSRPTGRVIADAFGAKRGYGTNLLRGVVPDVFLRWGSSREVPFQAGVCVQRAAAIRQAADKLVTFGLLREAGVPIPDFTPIRAHANGWSVAGKTVLGRTRHGARGRGIHVYEPGDWMDNHQLFVEFIPNDREYRLHVVGDKVVRVQRKYLDFPEQAGDGFVKNHEHGYRFRAPRQRLRPDREQAAIDAVKALGLDFGAVDLVIDRDDKAWVLEVNTAPACSCITATAYVGGIADLIRERTGEEIIPNYDALMVLRGEDRDTEE